MKNKLWIFIFAFLAICPGKSLGDEKRSEAVAVTQQDKERVVTGEVFDDQGPIIGATVRVKGTQNGKITDLDGKFTFRLVLPLWCPLWDTKTRKLSIKVRAS